MNEITLSKTEKRLVDIYICRDHPKTFDRSYFRQVLDNALPRWRSEQLSKSDLAYIDYVKDLTRLMKKYK